MGLVELCNLSHTSTLLASFLKPHFLSHVILVYVRFKGMCLAWRDIFYCFHGMIIIKTCVKPYLTTNFFWINTYDIIGFSMRHLNCTKQWAFNLLGLFVKFLGPNIGPLDYLARQGQQNGSNYLFYN